LLLAGGKIASAYIRKPAGTPPNWVFGPVWVFLYAMIGVSVAIIWERGANGGEVGKALILFVVQLTLNAVWTLIFFGLHQLLPALVVVGALWVVILVTIIAFLRHSKFAGCLLIPYLIWVTYATYLNAGCWLLNR
jgi:benzodiazapine receptor